VIFAGGCFHIGKGRWGNAGPIYDMCIVGWRIRCVNGRLFRRIGGLGVADTGCRDDVIMNNHLVVM
jgi:hypothetical protein